MRKIVLVAAIAGALVEPQSGDVSGTIGAEPHTQFDRLIEWIG